jgi:predicted RNA-binding Zn ribbon-like protein
METTGAGPRELPIVAGHLALDFANTVDDPEGPARYDHIADVPGLLTWTERLGILTGEERQRLARRASSRRRSDADVLEQAHRLRQIVNDVFADTATRGWPEASHWLRLRPFTAEAVARAELTPGEDGVALTWSQGADLDAVLYPVASAALDLLRSPDQHRVKRCAGCPWLFLDRSKNGSRRWCAMNDCGTHEKIRRYVERRAARRRS